MSIVPLDVNSPEFRYLMHDVVNQVHLIVEKLEAENLKTVAVEFNSSLSNPLSKLRKKFDMPSGNVVKVKRK